MRDAEKAKSKQKIRVLTNSAINDQPASSVLPKPRNPNPYPSLQHRRHQITLAIMMRGVGQGVFAVEARRQFVGAEHIG